MEENKGDSVLLEEKVPKSDALKNIQDSLQKA
jgi:hypothetical protein